jgi:hypothetical protein
VIPRDQFNIAEAKSIAALYGIDLVTVSAAGGGFSGACVHRAEDSSGSAFAMRRTPHSELMPTERYCEMVALLREMSSRGCGMIPVPLRHQQSSLTILQTLHQPAFVNLDSSQTRIQANDGVWQMEPWMLGEPAQGPPTPGQVQSTLEALSLFHNTAAECTQARSDARSIAPWFHVSEGYAPGISRRLSIVSELSDGLLTSFVKSVPAEPDPEFRDCAKRVCAALEFWLPWLRKQLTEVARSSYRLQPVVRDLWRPHVLFTADRLTGIIDLNAMATDHVGLDVTRLFRSWFGADIDRIREALTSFRSQRLLDANEWRLLQAYDASTALLSPVTWLRRRFIDAAADCASPEVLLRLAELTSVAERFEPL